MIGQTIGNYRITKLLGEGGMGAVYLAEHPGIGRKAVVKFLHPHLTRSEEIANRFFNEARAANAIGHPGIVDVLDFGTLSTGIAYIVMEFLQGESLAARLRRGRMRVSEAAEIVYQAASALGAAHAKGIVHRDLKPDNLFLVPDPQTPGRELVKVLDFGIAKLGAQTAPGGVKTQTGTVMGTPAYMSPEQCRGTKEIDRRTDIYALGIVLYEMLCGAPPFVSEGQGELIHLQISATPDPPRKRNPGIPEPLEKVVLRALEKDPNVRFQTMAELQQAIRGGPLRTVAATRVDPMAPTPPGNAPPRSPETTLSASVSVLERSLMRPPRWRSPAALVAGLGVAGVAAYFALARSETPTPPPGASTSAVVAPPVPADNPPPVAAPPTDKAPAAHADEGKRAAPPKEMVRIEVRDPAPLGLQVTVDGALADLPVQLARGAPAAELRFDAPGYETYVVRVDGSQDRKLLLPMRKLASSSATSGTSRKSRSGSSQPAAPVKPSPVAAPAPSKPAAAVAPPAPEPAPPPAPPPPPAKKSKLITDF